MPLPGSASETAIDTIVFDLGGVLIDWNPRYMYRSLFADPAEMEQFLAQVCTPDWNEEQDAGRRLAEATAELVGRHPEKAALIEAFYGRWEEMLGGVFEDTVQVLRTLHAQRRYRLYALTNWSDETFPVAVRRYDFLRLFDGIVMSGEERSRKPFPEFYRILLDRYRLTPGNTLFIDDNLRNVEAARALGIHAIHLPDPRQIGPALRQYHIRY